MTRSRVRRAIAAVLGVAFVTLVIGVVGFLWWAQPLPLLPEATAALASTPTVTFSEGDDGTLTFAPTGAPPNVGLVLYPGGKVPPAAYAPAAQAIAAEGYLVAIVSVPLNLAIFEVDAATPVMSDHPTVATWAVGGHSLGGAMAAQFIDGYEGTIDGLVLWASYSAADLADNGIRIVSSYGTLDNGASTFSSPDNLARLGPDVVIDPIEGGNHEQMGWYTGQPDDPPATISRSAQQNRIVTATARFLGDLEAISLRTR